MNGTTRLATPLVAALAIAGCSSGGSSSMPSGASAVPGQSVFLQTHGAVPEWMAKNEATAACPQVVGQPTCLALKRNGPQPNCSPSSNCGWTPKDLETRYKLPITKGSGQIVAIVDAGDHPDAATDLARYRKQFNLGTASFFKYNQNGEQSNYPTYTGWHLEIDLDIDMVSAACPLCTIYLVEANSASTTDLDTAEAVAAKLGAHIISNSWTCYGSINCVDKSDFDQPGVEYVAASGDAGFGENGAPEALGTVVSAGGTQLAKSGSTYTESIWNDAGGGCATGETKPTWQHDPDCSYRTDSDVSSEAGCSPGVAEYDTLSGGWTQVCGTSAASPLNAAIFGLAGNARSQDAAKKFWTLTKVQRKEDLHLVSGRDGTCGTYLCGDGRYERYYSGPGGWGSPSGIGAF